jgi:hypothetical protein
MYKLIRLCLVDLFPLVNGLESGCSLAFYKHILSRFALSLPLTTMIVSIFGEQITASFDESSVISWISRALAMSFNCHGNHISLPVNADMGQGSLTCVVDLMITDELAAGIILGKDWLAYYQEYLIFEGQLSENHHHNGGTQSDTNSGASAYLSCRKLPYFHCRY